MRDFFIGADGGGTKTRLQLEDANGHLLAEALSGPANVRSSVEGSWKSIMEGVHQLLHQAGLSLEDPTARFHIGLGLAGTEVKNVAQKFLSYAHPFHTLMLESDAYAACLGVHDGRDGAIIIIGTGVIGYQIESGTTSRVGGFGFPHDDLGGGAWFGLRACQLLLQACDGRRATTPLLEILFEHFRRDLNDLVAWANAATPGDFGTLAPIVIQEAARGELLAKALMKEAAEYIMLLDRALNKKLKQKDALLPCCLLGGIAPHLRPYLDASLLIRLKPRLQDAAKGAIYMIRNHVNQVQGSPS